MRRVGNSSGNAASSNEKVCMIRRRRVTRTSIVKELVTVLGEADPNETENATVTVHQPTTTTKSTETG